MYISEMHAILKPTSPSQRDTTHVNCICKEHLVYETAVLLCMDTANMDGDDSNKHNELPLNLLIQFHII